MTAPISRKQAWCKLAVLIAEELPAPKSIRLQGEEPDARPIVAIHTDSAADLAVWAEHLGCNVFEPQRSVSGDSWIHTGYGQWHGWRVTLTAYPPAEPEPEAVSEDMSQVREIAGSVSE